MAEALGEAHGGRRAAGRAGKVRCGAFGMSNSCKQELQQCAARALNLGPFISSCSLSVSEELPRCL